MALKLQTRQQFYDAEKAIEDALQKEQAHLPERVREHHPLPEIVNENTITHEVDGAPVKARKADYNGGDVRYYDAETGEHTPWCKTKEEAELEKNYLAEG